MADAKPNIILIVMDSARADRLSCYGYPRPTTPNLDSLAARGRRFQDCITPGCWTVPSHASLFTGLYPRQHGAHEGMLPDGLGLTLAERLERAGYHTLGISSNPYISPRRGFGRGFRVFREVWRGRPSLRRGQVLPWLGRRLGTVDNGSLRTHEAALAEIRHCPRPFFLFVNYMETHSPYLRFWPVGGRFVGRRLALRERWEMWRCHRQARQWDQFADSGPGFSGILGDLYDEDLCYLDRRIGDLVSDLDAIGVLADTLVIVTSDHGENMGEHGLVQHHLCLYDTLIRVPLIIHGMGVTQTSPPETGQVQLTDITPSLLRFLGLSECQQSDRGLDLFGTSVDTNYPPAFAQYELPEHVIQRWRARNIRFDFSRFARSLAAIRHEGHKYILSSDGSSELYDLRVDPGETNNIVSQDPSRARALSEQMAEWLGRHPPLGEETSVETDPEVEARLRELGYL